MDTAQRLVREGGQMLGRGQMRERGPVSPAPRMNRYRHAQKIRRRPIPRSRLLFPRSRFAQAKNPGNVSNR